MAEAFIGLGGNLGDRVQNLDEATVRLAGRPGIRLLARSSNYETPPWGDVDQPPYLNGALRLDTALSPHELLEAAQSVEAELGRVRERRWGPRTIDVDILAYDDRTVSDERLILPHPLLFERAFVLVPLVEIAPDLVLSGRPIRAALDRVDASEIKRV